MADKAAVSVPITNASMKAPSPRTCYYHPEQDFLRARASVVDASDIYAKTTEKQMET